MTKYYEEKQIIIVWHRVHRRLVYNVPGLEADRIHQLVMVVGNRTTLGFGYYPDSGSIYCRSLHEKIRRGKEPMEEA